MAEKISAGIFLYRINGNFPEVFLVHPGGPFWKNKDEGAWSIPKGEVEKNEDYLSVAKKEFLEETGKEIIGDFIALDPVIQKGGKKIYAWAVRGNLNVETIVSNTFSMVWPPKSGKLMEFPEVDQAQWFDFDQAKIKLNPAQAGLIDQLHAMLERLFSA